MIYLPVLYVFSASEDVTPDPYQDSVEERYNRSVKTGTGMHE